MLSSRGFRRENIRRFRVFLCEALDSMNLYVRELGAFLPIRLLCLGSLRKDTPVVYYNRSLGRLRAVCLASQAFILHISAGVSLCMSVWPYIIGALCKYVDFCLYDSAFV